MKRFATLAAVGLSLIFSSVSATASPLAAIVIDVREGEVLHSQNAEAPLHPAGLAKLMTLYMAFHMIRSGELDLEQYVTISDEAAAEPPVQLGLQSGMRVQLVHLIRAAAIMGANDAATALGEAVTTDKQTYEELAGHFAQKLGMTNSSFRNASGLTEDGQISTAEDIASLMLALRNDFPEFWNMFGRYSTNAGIKNVKHSGLLLLNSNDQIEALKVGMTRAAGFNGVGVATQEAKSVLVVVLGSRALTTLNAQMTDFYDMGFEKMLGAPRLED